MKKFILTCSSLLLTLFARDLRAAVIYWDPEGTYSYTGAGNNGYTGSLSQTWENSKWSTAVGGTTTGVAWVNNDAAVFSVGSGKATPAFTVTMNANHSVAGFFDGSLNPNSSTVTITGTGTITLTSGNLNGFATDNSSDGSLGYITINNVMTGSSTAGVAAEDTSQMFLNGVNTYVGGTYLGYTNWVTLPPGRAADAGMILNFNNSASFGTGPIYFLLCTGGAMVVEGTSPVTIPNPWVVYQEVSVPANFNIVGNPAGVTFSGPFTLTGGGGGTGAPGYTSTAVLPNYARLSLGSGASAANLITLSGVISGTNGFNKYGVGMMAITGNANTYGTDPVYGTTTVSNGWLVLANTSGSATGASPVATYGAGYLTGNGITSASVTNNGSISCTNLAGGCAILTTGPETWGFNSTNVFAISSPTGTAGATNGWDEVVVNGSVTFDSSGVFVVKVVSLGANNKAGALATFDNTQNYAMPFLTATGGFVNLNTANIILDTSAFGNDPGPGQFSVTVSADGKTLYVNFGQPPTITSITQPFTVATGGTAYITAVTSGGSLNYAWTKNGSPVSGAEYAGTTTSNLTIHPVQLSDGGEYVVTASSPGGNATAETAMVAIAPPTFSGSPGAGTFTLQFEGPTTGFWHNQGYRIWDSTDPTTPVNTWNILSNGNDFNPGVNTVTDNSANASAEYHVITVP